VARAFIRRIPSTILHTAIVKKEGLELEEAAQTQLLFLLLSSSKTLLN